MPWVDTLGYVNGGGNGGAYIKSGFGALNAPVHLPHGAVVTSMKAYFDDSSAADMTVILYGLNIAGCCYTTMARIDSTGNPGIDNLTDSTIAFSTIDNVNKSYLVKVYSTGWSSSLKIHGVVITYTVN